MARRMMTRVPRKKRTRVRRSRPPATGKERAIRPKSRIRMGKKK